MKFARWPYTSNAYPAPVRLTCALQRKTVCASDTIVLSENRGYRLYQLSSGGSSPTVAFLYQSTNAPGLGNSLFGGMGSGMPFFFDPWTYVQASVDRVEYVQYQSGIAIRYKDGATTGLN